MSDWQAWRDFCAAEERRLGSIQAHYADPWYGDCEEEKKEEDEDGDGKEDEE